MQADKGAEGLEAMKITHAAFADNKNSGLAAQVRSLGEEIKFAELELNKRLQDFFEAAPNSEKALLDIPTQREECCHVGGSLAFESEPGKGVTVVARIPSPPPGEKENHHA